MLPYISGIDLLRPFEGVSDVTLVAAMPPKPSKPSKPSNRSSGQQGASTTRRGGRRVTSTPNSVAVEASEVVREHREGSTLINFKALKNRS